MAISGTSPFPSPSLTLPKPFPSAGSLNSLSPQPVLPAPINTNWPGLNTNSPAASFSPVGPAVNGMVPVLRNQPTSPGGFSPPPALPTDLSGGLGDTFTPSSPSQSSLASTSAAQTPVANPFPGGNASLATEPGALPATGQAVGAEAAATGLPASNRPLNAQEMGQKVGSVVTKYMQENPALLDKMNSVNWDELEQDVGPKVEGYRARLQQALKKLPQGVDKRLIRMLDPGSRELATDFDEWLRKEPDPATLAELARQDRMKAREEALGSKADKTRVDSLNDPLADDPYAAEDPFADELAPEKTEPATFKDKLLGAKDKVVDKAKSSWPLNRNKQSDQDALMDEEPVSRPSKRPRPATDPFEGELTEADLDALLGGGPSRSHSAR